MESLPKHFDTPDRACDGFLTLSKRSKFACYPLNLTVIESDFFRSHFVVYSIVFIMLCNWSY